MQREQDPTNNNTPALPGGRQQFIQYLQQQQSLFQQREQQTSHLLTFLSKPNPTEFTDWNPSLNLPSGFLPPSSSFPSLLHTRSHPDNGRQDRDIDLEQEEDDELIDDEEDEEGDPSLSAPKPSLDDMPRTSEFVKKLYRMLEDPRFQKVVCWGTLGDCFVVKDMQECTKSILPRFFKHSNFSSFVRQLNKYGFRKIKSVEAVHEYGAQSWIFQHSEFRAGHPEDLEKIKRKAAAAPRKSGPEPKPPPSLPGPGPPVSLVGPAAESTSAPKVNRPALRRGLSAPQPPQTQPFVDTVNQNLQERLTTLERNQEVLLDEMISFQKGLEERNELIQALIALSLQSRSADEDAALDTSISTHGPNIRGLQSSGLRLDANPNPPLPIQQPGSSYSLPFLSATDFRLIQPSFSPTDLRSFRDSNTSQSSSQYFQSNTTTLGHRRNPRRYSTGGAGQSGTRLADNDMASYDLSFIDSQVNQDTEDYSFR